MSARELVTVHRLIFGRTIGFRRTEHSSQIVEPVNRDISKASDLIISDENSWNVQLVRERLDFIQ